METPKLAKQAEHLMHYLRSVGVLRPFLTDHFRKSTLPLQNLGTSPILGTRSMKRKAVDSEESSNLKRQREKVPEYCDIRTRQDDDGATLWPAAPKAVKAAQVFLKEWYVLEQSLFVYTSSSRS